MHNSDFLAEATEKKGSGINVSYLPGLVKKYSYVLVFLIILAVYAIVSNELTLNALMNVFRHSAVIGVIAVGMGVICLTGDIDLSMGSMLALVAGFSVVVFNATGNILLTLLFALAFGAVCGLVNSVFVGIFEIPASIVTLATMLIYRSLAQYACQHLPSELIGNGSSVYRMSRDTDAYQALYSFGNGKLAGIMPIVDVVLLLVIVLFVYLGISTKFGKKIYAVGSNAKAARLAGISVPVMKTLVFVIGGALVGLAGFLWIAMNASADPATTGSSYGMYAITAVVLGGISMSGARGQLLGVLFGAMSYTVIDKVIIALKMDSLINDTIKGVILTVAIFIQMAGPKIKGLFHRKAAEKQVPAPGAPVGRLRRGRWAAELRGGCPGSWSGCGPVKLRPSRPTARPASGPTGYLRTPPNEPSSFSKPPACGFPCPAGGFGLRPAAGCFKWRNLGLSRPSILRWRAWGGRGLCGDALPRWVTLRAVYNARREFAQAPRLKGAPWRPTSRSSSSSWSSLTCSSLGSSRSRADGSRRFS